MASGFIQRFKGKIVAHSLFVPAGGLGDKVSGILASSDFIQKLPVQAVAAATQDYGPLSLPAGAILLSASFYTTVAFGAVTDAKISIGKTAGAQEYVAQVSVKAAGVVALSLVASELALSNLPAAPNLFVRITQTGTASATGTGLLVVNYTV